MSVCLFLPHDEPVSALYILMVLYAFAFVYLMCSAKFNLGSKVRPSILGNGYVAMILLLMLMLRDFEYSAGSGVKSVDWVLEVFMIRLFWVASLLWNRGMVEDEFLQF